MLYQRTAFRKISFYTEEKQSEKKIESPAIRKYEGFIFALTGANEDLDSIDTEESEAEIKQEEHEERSYDNDDGDEDYDEDEENIEELL
ncbi:MAG TPA: hypothetical protein PKD96_02495 [Candidatus Absconditabacterales bacterium]|nr:hypothetical protein [Candidatus Absconditabacterales bacterium]HMT27150.1 hypothetical protein [Candidatus Absconditabacterales bacterium]